MNLELNCQRAKWGRSEGITGQPLKAAATKEIGSVNLIISKR